MKKYRLIDYYDGEPELICESDDIAEIQLAARLRKQDTDGECLLYLEEELL
jgi:arginine/ornithine N-succinyltransferase beta subunit